MPIDGKQGFADTVNCFFTVGKQGEYINYDIYDWRDGKKVAEYAYGKLIMK